MFQLNFKSVHRYNSSFSGIEVPVELSVDMHRSIALLAKVDTGAASCIFQREYADLLELQMDKGDQRIFSTATGTLETRGHVMTVSSMGYTVESLVFFAVHSGLPRNVLGLHGWLEKFRFGLVHYDRAIYLSNYAE